MNFRRSYQIWIPIFYNFPYSDQVVISAFTTGAEYNVILLVHLLELHINTIFVINPVGVVVDSFISL